MSRTGRTCGSSTSRQEKERERERERHERVNGSKFGACSPGEALHSTKEETATRIKVTHTGETIDEADVTLSNRYNLEAVNPGDNPAGTKMASGMTMEEIHHGLRIGEGPPPPPQS